MGGFWQDTGNSEYRLRPRYGFDPKWILERWRPAAIFGTPDSWDQQTITPDGFYSIGPFPAHGRFESCGPFSTGKGISGYVPLEPGMVELTARAVWMGRINSYGDIREVLMRQELAKERAQDETFDLMWDEQQLTRPNLTIGAGGAFDKQKEIDDYARKIERANAFVDARQFRRGFRQN